MKLRTIQEADIKNKRVLLRVDFNVPVGNNKIKDEYKIDCALATINLLLRKGARQIIIISHFGRPRGKRIKSMSLRPVFRALKRKIQSVHVKFVVDKIDERLGKKIERISARIILLENVRFEKGEDENDDKLAREIASFADVYVNDAFACSHRKAASITAIAKYLKSYAGLNLLKEVSYLTSALAPRKPALALIGGAKIESKLPMIKNFLKIYDYILVGGGVANTILAGLNYKVGKSLVDKEYLKDARLLAKSRKLIIPKDVVISNGDKNGSTRVVRISAEHKICSANEQILDIGPKTIIYYSSLIRQAQTIIWAGPMGQIENPKFKHGTIALAKIIGARASGKALGMAGGGETLMAIHQSKMGRYYDFISTGGGAMLEFLSGKKLSGIDALILK
ncbi:phosphoglycerate kinase [Candidatus Falkowbacteria bacterium]|nr:phosphoglycerate kinase [Candidatus Falkowbacteria bacterium]